MDPNSAWAELIEALNSGNFDDGVAIATDLQAWLNRGGFPPTVIEQLQPASQELSAAVGILQRELALRACAVVLTLG